MPAETVLDDLVGHAQRGVDQQGMLGDFAIPRGLPRFRNRLDEVLQGLVRVEIRELEPLHYAFDEGLHLLRRLLHPVTLRDEGEAVDVETVLGEEDDAEGDLVGPQIRRARLIERSDGVDIPVDQRLNVQPRLQIGYVHLRSVDVVGLGERRPQVSRPAARRAAQFVSFEILRRPDAGVLESDDADRRALIDHSDGHQRQPGAGALEHRRDVGLSEVVAAQPHRLRGVARAEAARDRDVEPAVLPESLLARGVHEGDLAFRKPWQRQLDRIGRLGIEAHEYGIDRAGARHPTQSAQHGSAGKPVVIHGIPPIRIVVIRILVVKFEFSPRRSV